MACLSLCVLCCCVCGYECIPALDFNAHVPIIGHLHQLTHRTLFHRINQKQNHRGFHGHPRFSPWYKSTVNLTKKNIHSRNKVYYVFYFVFVVVIINFYPYVLEWRSVFFWGSEVHQRKCRLVAALDIISRRPFPLLFTTISTE